MHPRPRRAGGVAVAALAAVTIAMAGPASAQASPAPTLDGLCWMGPNRPIHRAQNTAGDAIPYSFRSGRATRSGTLATAVAPDDTATSAYFVARGQFPAVEPVELWWWSLDGRAALAQDEGIEASYCTYGLRPVVHWLDAEGAPATPPPDVPAVVSLTSALGQLVCRGVGGGLTCTEQPAEGSPLPPGSYATRANELQVAAFSTGRATPSYTVAATPPAGFVASGTGTFALDDLGSGLGQANADARLRPFFAGGSGDMAQASEVVVTFRIPGPEVPPSEEVASPSAGASTPTTVASSAESAAPTTAAPRPSPSPVLSVPAAALNPLPGATGPTVVMVVGAAVVAVAMARLVGDRERRPRRVRRRRL